MSRSNPPRSSIVAGLRQKRSDLEADRSTPTPSKPKRPLARRLAIKLASVTLWLHIYVSMFGLAIVLFFSVTGVTLNHPDWFFEQAERTVDASGKLDPKWLYPEVTDVPDQVARLEIVEYLRKENGVRGSVADFRIEPGECSVSFKGPGYAADATINRETGEYKLTQQYHGLIAVINDLHKGRDTGPVWSILIDASAILLTIISFTGLILLFYLKLRRGNGLLVGLAGTVALAVVWWFGVS